MKAHQNNDMWKSIKIIIWNLRIPLKYTFSIFLLCVISVRNEHVTWGQTLHTMILVVWISKKPDETDQSAAVWQSSNSPAATLLSGRNHASSMLGSWWQAYRFMWRPQNHEILLRPRSERESEILKRLCVKGVYTAKEEKKEEMEDWGEEW